jgi:hypothetical protein
MNKLKKKLDFCLGCSNNKYNIFFGGGGWGSDDTASYLEAGSSDGVKCNLFCKYTQNNRHW